MTFNPKSLSTEELKKWESDLIHLARNHSCKSYREKYTKFLQTVQQEIDYRKDMVENSDN